MDVCVYEGHKFNSQCQTSCSFLIEDSKGSALDLVQEPASPSLPLLWEFRLLLSCQGNHLKGMRNLATDHTRPICKCYLQSVIVSTCSPHQNCTEEEETNGNGNKRTKESVQCERIMPNISSCVTGACVGLIRCNNDIYMHILKLLLTSKSVCFP
jgi:hypothetical protein